ncbi:transposase-like protein [Rhizobium giardinii]|uniref:Transposase-like protein n=1 Tax=Rhizobium giardinii TaxID=56731 RepID=A0A7W8UGN7_9HYPH|nr:transposase-like protein [Rhizobium giardinii]
MTNDMMNLRSLVEKSADADLLREMIGFAAEKLMELEVGAKTGAGCGAKNAFRLASRNGYRDRDWRRGLEQSSCASRSFAPAATSRASLSRGVWRRRP